VLVGTLAASLVQAQNVAAAGITQKTIGELETRDAQTGRRFVLTPADRVVGGDRLVYTVEIRNITARPIEQILAVSPIPARMVYVEGSATGPGCEIDFSVDGGASFGAPKSLLVKLPGGQFRPAVVADYTHIRWKLQFALSGSSTAYARFRAVLK
jgi:uncharacterized repeat protein (TIGR01451 family)